MVGIDVGDHRNHRREEQEGGIGLICLGDNEVSGTQTRIRSGSVQTSADYEGGIHAALGHDRRHEAGRRRLAVCSGNGNTLLETHQFGQHLRTRNDRHVTLACRDNFRVISGHRSGHHHRISVADIFAGVASYDTYAQARQPACRGVIGEIRTTDAKAEVDQDFGNAAHARATDADKVDVFDFMFHLALISLA